MKRNKSLVIRSLGKKGEKKGKKVYGHWGKKEKVGIDLW